MDFITICDYIGTFAFAVSGIRLAAAKEMDWFGALVIGMVTAVGGGTLRDVLIGVPPFWMLQPSYISITAASLLFVILFRDKLVRLNQTFFLFDAVGLGLFTIVGVNKTLDLGYPFWVAIIMGTITGSFGGMIRDILINEVPLIFRKDIYALACVIGGLLYVICLQLSLNVAFSQLIAAASVVLVRIVAMKYHISLPQLKQENT